MKIVLVGSGNVATVLGRMIHSGGHSICQVISRDATHAKRLGDEWGAAYGDLTTPIDPSTDLCIIAVKDHAIEAVSQLIRTRTITVVHTAGSVSKEILRPISTNYGVIYPLQSLRKEIVPGQPVPLLVDGNSTDTITFLQDFALSISTKVAIAGDEERLKMHLAAVVVSNFTNHLYALAGDYCKKQDLDFKLLIPLIEETAHRVAAESPATMQTGPAIRKDKATIEKHLDMLESDPKFREIYRLLSKSISDHHPSKD